MAIIEKCCCCRWTLRMGCYVSATFSLIYFFIFTMITGSMTIGRLFNMDEHENESHIGGSYSDNMGTRAPLHELQNQRHVTDRISPVTSHPSKSSSSSSSSGNRMENGWENNITERILTVSDPSVQVKNQADRSMSVLEVVLESDAYAILQTVNLVLDLLCEIVGVYASILLIRGLLKERKTWFWPWMIVVPLHIAIDAFTISGILMEHYVNPMSNKIRLVLITIVVDVTLNSINAYGLLCVISQYQEYKAGRGTAAYVEFTSQTPAIMLETASSTKTVLTKPNSLHSNASRRSTKDFSTSRTLCNDKSDSYCEEFSLQALSNVNEKRCPPTEDCLTKQENKVQNGPDILTFGDDSGVTPTSRVYNNLREVTRKETPATNDKCNPELEKNDPKYIANKFGKYLDVKSGNGGRKQSNSSECEDHRTVKFIPSGNSQSALPNHNGKLSWYTNDQSSTTKSDSDSEDLADDALSAFGIIINGKN